MFSSLLLFHHHHPSSTLNCITSLTPFNPTPPPPQHQQNSHHSLSLSQALPFSTLLYAPAFSSRCILPNINPLPPPSTTSPFTTIQNHSSPSSWFPPPGHALKMSPLPPFDSPLVFDWKDMDIEDKIVRVVNVKKMKLKWRIGVEGWEWWGYQNIR